VSRALLTRRVAFTAQHRYRLPQWDEEHNRLVFGECAGKDFHEHHYVCDVTVGGEIDHTTGFVVDLEELDDVIQDVVIVRFDKRNINRDVPEFQEGRLVPSGENLARFIFERIEESLGDRGTVVSVRLAEDDTLWATYNGGG
jgi:6-pyruvoyltetrahydropterin/6-carboxytetrahydropterin synthase